MAGINTYDKTKQRIGRDHLLWVNTLATFTQLHFLQLCKRHYESQSRHMRTLRCILKLEPAQLTQSCLFLCCHEVPGNGIEIWIPILVLPLVY